MKFAGATTAALFLQRFIDREKTKWAHIDIAGTAFNYEEKHYKSLGGTGFGVRLLIDFILNHEK